jgi:hypothetical protein
MGSAASELRKSNKTGTGAVIFSSSRFRAIAGCHSLLEAPDFESGERLP